MNSSAESELLRLSHQLGSPSRSWAILGEGNASARIDNDLFLVKASGASMTTLRAEQISTLRFAPLVDAVLSGADYADSDCRALLTDALAGEGRHAAPSVECVFHADLLSFLRADFIGHTHVESINSLACSARGWELLMQGGRLFPDEIVVCGPAPCCVPYVDPGLPLARAIHVAVDAYIRRWALRPRTIILQNHGFIAVGRSVDEVVSITMMADKAARILLGAIACGGPRFMDEGDVRRILTRSDEHERARRLGLSSSATNGDSDCFKEETA